MSRSHEKGQTLVELAIVLPLFCFGVFTAVQAGRFIHNQVELQQMASVASGSITPENSQKSSLYPRFNSLTNLTNYPMLHRRAGPVTGWRPHKSVVDPLIPGVIKTVHAPGQFVSIKVQTALNAGGGFTRVLPRIQQQAFAETLLEPAVPEDR